MFPLDSDPEYKEMEEAHYAYRVRHRLRKQVLVPLREAVNLPESFKRSKIETERYTGYSLLQSSWLCYNAQVLETVAEKRCLNCWDWERFAKIVDRQWREMVEGHIKKGKFGSCLAVCFRGNNHLQMDIIASLGLSVSDVAEEPWRKYILVFNSEPELVKFDLSELLDSDGSYLCSLWERYAYLKISLPKKNGDFRKIADVILQFAIENKLSRDKMVKRLSVFYDSYFGEALGYDDLVWGGDSWEKDYEVLRNNMKKGVAILNRHSKILMKYFLEEGGRMRPEDVMRWAIYGEKYKHLVKAFVWVGRRAETEGASETPGTPDGHLQRRHYGNGSGAPTELSQ
ncbi:hypothetical protein RHSIM_Rhsim08G0161800 [Rhododendron simsii]|uniref:Uncharacterized protein n=1 Tax=Rhododendron simsii TaxID=118357 RepID=A0A834GSV5_RHOSS|nr:hypothetical protein RHSIM_Rhsim08G0161800 [Rhododendron simsii]